jgi:Flp pilus assembly protein TadD
MDGVTRVVHNLEPYDIYRWAGELFDQRDYSAAARALEQLVENHPHEAELGAARELLARSYFHSAQLGRAIAAARDLLRRQPDNPYAAQILARTLERASRHDEAGAVRRVAAALGAAD